MTAFTEEQMKILNTAFDHTSRRVWESQRELSRVYRRLSALCDVLEEDEPVNTFDVLLKGKHGYGVSMVWEPDTMDIKFDQTILHHILEGDLSASEHCFNREAAALRIRQAELYKHMCGECRLRDDYEDDEDKDNRDICDQASAYDGGRVLYNRKNPLDVACARQRCYEEWAKKQVNARCQCCGADYYSKDEEERQNAADALMQGNLHTDDAAGEPAPQTEA